MKVLVIGGNGFIGSPLVRELRGFGHDVAVLHRDAKAGESSGVLQIRGDRNRLADVLGDLQGFGPDVIVDLVLSSGQQARELMQVANALSCRVVAISSMDVYRAWGVFTGIETGPNEPLPLTESSPLRRNHQTYPPGAIQKMQGVFSWLTDDYDKIAVEAEVMGAGNVDGTVVRLPMVYGPGDPLHRWFPVLKRVTDHRPFMLLQEGWAEWRCPRGYVDDVAHGIALAATSDSAAGVYNVCQEPSVPELEWQKLIADQMQWPGRFVVIREENVPVHLRAPSNPSQHVVASSARIRNELGYAETVPRSEAMRRTADWELQNPPATIDPKLFDYAAENAALELHERQQRPAD